MDDTENDEGDIQEYILSMFPGYRTHVFGNMAWHRGVVA